VSRSRSKSGARAARTDRVDTGTSSRGRPSEATHVPGRSLSEVTPKASRTASCSSAEGSHTSTRPGSNAASNRPFTRVTQPAKVRPNVPMVARHSVPPARSATNANAATVPCPHAGSSPVAVKKRKVTSKPSCRLFSTATNTACDVPVRTGTLRSSSSLRAVSSNTAVGLPPRPPRMHAFTIVRDRRFPFRAMTSVGRVLIACWGTRGRPETSSGQGQRDVTTLLCV
jgi:hypothetical protein